ncbi:MAG: hypothetical protein IT426_07640 [Pirellulales bacterium]|nr:hypothetical protein [Pirellulales bacterium]
MRSRIFSANGHEKIAAAITAYLNGRDNILSAATSQSPRATGDAIQGILSREFPKFIEEWCSAYSAEFARRAMADLAFSDKDDFYYVVDVKTHREDTKFNMPNLTSVERLTRFYEDDKNYFVVLLVKYLVEGLRVVVSETKFLPIEFLDWDCLTIGALGWGQIQIANSNRIATNIGYSRKKWMLELCDAVLEFYPREIDKITERISHFESIREFWLAKTDE